MPTAFPVSLTLSSPRASEDRGKRSHAGNEVVGMRDDVLLLQDYGNFLKDEEYWILSLHVVLNIGTRSSLRAMIFHHIGGL